METVLAFITSANHEMVISLCHHCVNTTNSCTSSLTVHKPAYFHLEKTSQRLRYIADQITGIRLLGETDD